MRFDFKIVTDRRVYVELKKEEEENNKGINAIITMNNFKLNQNV